MNARALLQAQGWRGEGHTLHATNDSIGLKARLLVGRKVNGAGLGASKAVDDQWWLSALDEQLSGLTTKDGKLVQTLKNGKIDRLKEDVGKSDLYKLFVSGGTLEGTVDRLPAEMTTGTASPPSVAKKGPKDSKSRTPTMNAHPTETESTSSSSESNGQRKESKEERRARKEARRQRRELRRTRREARKMKSSTATSAADEASDASLTVGFSKACRIGKGDIKVRLPLIKLRFDISLHLI